MFFKKQTNELKKFKDDEMRKIIEIFKKQKKILINLMAAGLIGLSALTLITYISVKDKVAVLVGNGCNPLPGM